MSHLLRTVEVFVDDDAVVLAATLRVNGTPQNLTGASVVSRIKPTGEASYDTAMAITNPATSGHVSRALAAGEVDTPLTAVLEFVVTFAGGTQATFPGPNEDAAAFIVTARRT